ncbi:hypothetical protein JCM16303_001061 [Sporobolomyces ruberrimus]
MRFHHSHHNSISHPSDLHPLAPAPTCPPTFSSAPTHRRPLTPYTSRDECDVETVNGGMFSRRSRSLSRGGRSTPLLFPQHHEETQSPTLHAYEEDRESVRQWQERGEQEEDAFKPISNSSSRAQSVRSDSPRRSPSPRTPFSPPSSSSRPTPDNGDFSSESETESIPLSRLEASSSSALFAPTSSLSSHKVHKLDQNFHREENRVRKNGMRKFKAELDVAVGVGRLWKVEREGKKRSREGGEQGGGGGMGGVEEMFERVKEGVEETLEGSQRGKGKEDRLSLSGDRKSPKNGGEGIDFRKVVGGAVGVAGLAGAVGVGWEMYRRYEGKEKKRNELEVVRPHRGLTLFVKRTATTAIPSIPRPFPPPTTSPPIFICHLTPSQHKTLQHASAALLLKQHERHHNGRENGKEFYHDEIGLIVGAVVGGWKEVGGLVEEGMRKVERSSGRRSQRLFGVDLKELTKHEGVETKHGIDPNAKGFRIPEFLDHLITALKQSDLSVSGILRKTGNVSKLLRIVDALDHANGSNETVLDLAKIDPVTLANLFTRFLGALPHPVFTHHLFGLFIATSHITHPGLRRRAMHLVICLMPKVNRDVMECVFLFLSWLSKHAHLNIIDGDQMDLTGIANVMAPVLLSPKNRDPHPDELKSMIAAVLNLLEDQHILHEIPLELAHLLHIDPPAPPRKGEDHDVAGFIKHLFEKL